MRKLAKNKVVLVFGGCAAVALALFSKPFSETVATYFSPSASKMDCPFAFALPDLTRIIECSSTRNIDFTHEMSAHVNQDEFEAFVDATGIGNQARLDEPIDYIFEQTADNGGVTMHEEYDTRIFTSVTWSNGILHIYSYST